MPVEVTMSTEEMVLLSAWPETAAGNPDEVEGNVEFEVLSGDCTIGPREDALRVWVISGDVPGDSVVRARGDADLGAGVMHIEDTATVHVFDPVATVLRLTADTPVLKT